MTVIERFLKYVSFDTQSDENSGATPSTPKQMVFAQYLRSELEQLGFQEISLDENGYLFATWPANTDKPVPTIGFIAHMDTSPDMTGAGVTPRIVYGYDGTDIVLCEEDNIILSPKQFPELLDHKGEDLIVTNGKTLLGADDKAGIAEIISAMVYLKEHPEIKHGKIRVGFNPDEEIGLGAHKFDVERFGCEWAYTMDGGEVGELEFENFNAASAKVIIKGRNVHPVYAKDKTASEKSLVDYYEFVKNSLNCPPKDNLIIHGSSLLSVPYCVDLRGLRVMRSGLYIGELKKNRFEPSQAFAMTLKKEDAKISIDFNLDDENLKRYMRGESFAVDCNDGWCLVCVNGYPLGWGKVTKGRLKNKYLPSWMNI